MKKAFVAVFSMVLLLMIGIVGVKAYNNVTQLYNNTNYSIASGGTFNTTKSSSGTLLLANISPSQVYSGKNTFVGYLKVGALYIQKCSKVYNFDASYSNFYIGNMTSSGTWKMEDQAKYNGSNNIGWSGVLGFKSATS